MVIVRKTIYSGSNSEPVETEEFRMANLSAAWNLTKELADAVKETYGTLTGLRGTNATIELGITIE